MLTNAVFRILVLSLRDPNGKNGTPCWKNAHGILFTLTELNLNLDNDRGFGSSRYGVDARG